MRGHKQNRERVGVLSLATRIRRREAKEYHVQASDGGRQGSLKKYQKPHQQPQGETHRRATAFSRQNVQGKDIDFNHIATKTNIQTSWLRRSMKPRS